MLMLILTYGAEPFLRSCQLCSYSRTSQHFKEPEGSSPLVPILSLIDPVHTIPSYLSKIYFNIVHPPSDRAVAQRLDAGFPPRQPRFTYGQHVGFVVDKAALGQVYSEYFGFPCQSFHRVLHYHNHPGLTQFGH
jgi:hypothetical protein